MTELFNLLNLIIGLGLGIIIGGLAMKTKKEDDK